MGEYCTKPSDILAVMKEIKDGLGEVHVYLLSCMIVYYKYLFPKVLCFDEDKLIKFFESFSVPFSFWYWELQIFGVIIEDIFAFFN